MSTELPVGILYWAKRHPTTFNGKIETRHISIEKLFLKMDKENYEDSINTMMEIEKSRFFMFWMTSPEGQDFLKTHAECFMDEILKGIDFQE